MIDSFKPIKTIWNEAGKQWGQFTAGFSGIMDNMMEGWNRQLAYATGGDYYTGKVDATNVRDKQLKGAAGTR